MKIIRTAVAGVVIAVAAASGYAVLSRNAELARRAEGVHNLQQWGIALNLYLMENDNQLPSVGKEPVTAEQTNAWFNGLPPYISQTPLTDLAEGSRPRPGVPSLWIDPFTKPVRVWDPSVFYFNYGMNAALQPDPALRSFRIYELPSPDHIVFMTGVDGFSPSVTPETVVFRQGPATSPKASALVLFADGHVEPVLRSILVMEPATRSAEAAATGVSWFLPE